MELQLPSTRDGLAVLLLSLPLQEDLSEIAVMEEEEAIDIVIETTTVEEVETMTADDHPEGTDTVGILDLLPHPVVIAITVKTEESLGNTRAVIIARDHFRRHPAGIRTTRERRTRKDQEFKHTQIGLM